MTERLFLSGKIILFFTGRDGDIATLVFFQKLFGENFKFLLSFGVGISCIQVAVSFCGEWSHRVLSLRDIFAFVKRKDNLKILFCFVIKYHDL